MATRAPGPIADESAGKANERELHSSRHKVHVEFEKFYGTEPRHVDRRFELSLSDLTYLPKVDRFAFTFLISDVSFWPIPTDELQIGRSMIPTPTG